MAHINLGGKKKGCNKEKSGKRLTKWAPKVK
jgi:hypothetical protein